MEEIREFVGETPEIAAQKAAQYFGVPLGQVDVRVISDRLRISGLGARVLVLAAIRQQEEAEEEDVQLGPVGEFVAGILRRLRLPGRIRVDEFEAEGEVVLTLRGDGAHDLGRRDSRLLEALSHLASRMVQKRTDGASARVEVEGDGSADPKLESTARRAAEEVQKTGAAVELAPMNSRQRFVVHTALRDFDKVRTESVGEGRERRVRIVPA